MIAQREWKASQQAFTNSNEGLLAVAQEGTTSGAAGGAVTGAIIGGPVGAAVGGIAGAVLGTAIDPPPERVVRYVREQPMPAEPATVQAEVVVDQPLPPTVVLTPVPEAPDYAYTYANERRVIADPQDLHRGPGHRLITGSTTGSPARALGSYAVSSPPT